MFSMRWCVLSVPCSHIHFGWLLGLHSLMSVWNTAHVYAFVCMHTLMTLFSLAASNQLRVHWGFCCLCSITAALRYQHPFPTPTRPAAAYATVIVFHMPFLLTCIHKKNFIGRRLAALLITSINLCLSLPLEDTPACCRYYWYRQCLSYF